MSLRSLKSGRFAFLWIFTALVLIAYGVSEAGTRYFDQYGREVDESQYREIIKDWNEHVIQKRGADSPIPHLREGVYAPAPPPSASEPLSEPLPQTAPAPVITPETRTDTGVSGPSPRALQKPANTLNLFQAAPEKKKLPLWVVRSGNKSLYLLGSVHVLRKDSYPLPAPIMNAYNQCVQMAFEMNLDEMNTPAMQSKLMQWGMNPQGTVLKDLVSQPTYEALAARLKANGISVERMAAFRPWFCAIMLTMAEFRRLGLDPQFGVDQYFHKEAKLDRKRLVYFETAEEQFRLFTGLGEGDQETFVRQTLKDLENIRIKISDLMKAWETGDVPVLESVLSESFREYPVMYERFITRRNRNWISRIEEMMKTEGDGLVVVGCLHLVGKDSVIELLRQRGYQAMQMTE